MPVNITTLKFDPALGYDTFHTVTTLDFDTSVYCSPEDAADGLFEELNSFASDNDFSEGSVGLWTPDEAKAQGLGNRYCVSWEEGPYQWAINLSMNLHGPGWYTEAHNAFTLCFEPK